MQQTEQLDLTKILDITSKRKWLILFCLIGILSPVIFYNHISIPVYESSTTIVFEEQQGAVTTINPFKISLNKSFIINQIEEIKSRSLVDEVVNELAPGIINTFPIPSELDKTFNKEKFIANEIQQRIFANSVPNSEIIKIKIEAYSPIAAQVIANTVAEVLKKRNLDVRREESNNVRKIIEEQLVTFKKQLDESEIALKIFKEKSNVTVIDREAEEIFRRITEAEVAYNQAKANLDGAQKRYSFIQEKLIKERKDLVPSITKITSPWAQKLKEQLVELEVKYTTLKVQNYAEDHPKMIEIQKQIEQTKNNLKEESLKIASGENIVDPITQIQKYMEESIALEIEIQSYQAQEKALSDVIDGYKTNLNTMPDKELRLAQLMRDKEVNERIYTMLLQKREEAKIAEAERVGNIRIIDPADTPNSPIKPRKVLNLLVGIILGICVGIVVAFILEFMDNSVKSVAEAEQITSLSVLGTIPRIRSINNSLLPSVTKKNNGSSVPVMVSRLITKLNSKSPESEAFRTLRTNLQFSGIDSPLKTVLVTSANPSEGKSLIIANLSIATAQMGLNTLLIDADVRKPILHMLFELQREPGLINVITTVPHRQRSVHLKTHNVSIDNIDDDAENGNAKPAMKKIDLLEAIQKTNIENLDLITAGTIPPNPSEILGSKAMRGIIDELKNIYDAIFIDTPPINIVTDAGILGAFMDGAVLVLKAGSTTRNDLVHARSLLQKSNSKVVGLVVNQIQPQDGYSNYYYYYYFNDSADGKRVKRRKVKHN
jgi:capsular exopolysaccharide synthesis family protein